MSKFTDQSSDRTGAAILSANMDDPLRLHIWIDTIYTGKSIRDSGYDHAEILRLSIWIGNEYFESPIDEILRLSFLTSSIYRLLSSQSLPWASLGLTLCMFKVDEKGNDQESIQTNSTSCPKHQTGKGHLQLRGH